MFPSNYSPLRTPYSGGSQITVTNQYSTGICNLRLGDLDFIVIATGSIIGNLWDEVRNQTVFDEVMKELISMPEDEGYYKYVNRDGIVQIPYPFSGR